MVGDVIACPDPPPPPQAVNNTQALAPTASLQIDRIFILEGVAGERSLALQKSYAATRLGQNTEEADSQ